MITKKNMVRYNAPYTKCPPADMLPLEQVLCMIWLANNQTLVQLRQHQNLLNTQIIMAVKNHLPERTLDNLSMMIDNVTAAVAYQTFKEDNFWLAFIQTKELN